MAIKAADTLKPNGSFALAEAADIDINGQALTDYLANLSAGKGEKGDTGTGIKSVTTEAVDGGTSVTVTLSDAEATKTVFTVKDGQDGINGVGIKSVASKAFEGGNTVTVTLNDAGETKTEFTVLDGQPGGRGDRGPQGDNGASAHIVQTITTDDDGIEHVYIKTWVGDDEANAVTSPDLMVQVNDVMSALTEIMNEYTGATE